MSRTWVPLQGISDNLSFRQDMELHVLVNVGFYLVVQLRSWVLGKCEREESNIVIKTASLAGTTRVKLCEG